jgi:hypothetical protein
MRAASAAGMSTCLALAHGRRDVADRTTELEGDAGVEDALDLCVHHIAGQAVLGDAEAHHATGHRPRLLDGDGVAEPRQVIGGGQATRPGADDEHLPAARRGVQRDGPALANREVTEKSLDGVDADGRIQPATVAGVLTRVIARTPHDRRQRIIPHEDLPRRAVVARLGVIEPRLDVLPRGTCLVARRQSIDIHRPLGAPAAGLVDQARADVEGDGEGRLAPRGLAAHRSASPPGARSKRATLRSAIACSASS